MCVGKRQGVGWHLFSSRNTSEGDVEGAARHGERVVRLLEK